MGRGLLTLRFWVWIDVNGLWSWVPSIRVMVPDGWVQRLSVEVVLDQIRLINCSPEHDSSLRLDVDTERRRSGAGTGRDAFRARIRAGR